ncbi:hypothetical protein CHI12_06635 [Terribacillus saccharophilus]|uniref:DUF2247 domain-containing protein n=1 Tax=Terribacillus saccharophilus TaxID=361277 RepID=A0A268HES5_9BACI|nr:DUF2247 family protein [Terribacillus saccharophilus]PAE08368.1 hypothetical protein CHI12_06635 [Terribacillus saccharophilus]
MKIPVNFFKENNIRYDWRTIFTGFKMHILKSEDITNYAVEYLTIHPETENENIIQLAWGGHQLDSDSLLSNILQDYYNSDLNIENDEWHIEKRKWRFCILTLLKIKYQDNSEELLNIITEVYADFNYPEDMDSFINYLTPKDGYDPSKYSKEENVSRLISLFNEFLDKERHYLQGI